ncbi:uncharacterized protein LOC113287919 isoform X1 [Papaver somniferum]|uniref:uncharacterized protein LOC113287919 isoform X1 n=1 Tax=Papaver somniferum TaxID=3469 RepID=UPI000E6FE432|nr:uncharacterized protein LOC113287919 isoform X1 [Papaver somniferum]
MLNSIFQKQITTVVSIPPPCRLNFSRALKSALDKVLARPVDLVVWLHLLLLPVCTLNLYIPKGTGEERSGVRKKLQIAAINQPLCKWREPKGCVVLVQNLLDLTKHSAKQQRPRRKKEENANIQACKKKINFGHFTAVIRVLFSDGIAPATSETLHDLQQKHPFARPPIVPADDITTPSLDVDATLVLFALKSFPKGTSCARYGLRDQHLLDAMSGTTAAVDDDLLQSIAGVVNLWLTGLCPPILGEYVANALLIPLLKPGGGLRPTAVGTIWRRLCSKLAASVACKHITSYLGTHQFGVGIPGGGGYTARS